MAPKKVDLASLADNLGTVKKTLEERKELSATTVAVTITLTFMASTLLILWGTYAIARHTPTMQKN